MTLLTRSQRIHIEGKSRTTFTSISFGWFTESRVQSNLELEAELYLESLHGLAVVIGKKWTHAPAASVLTFSLSATEIQGSFQQSAIDQLQATVGGFLTQLKANSVSIVVPQELLEATKQRFETAPLVEPVTAGPELLSSTLQQNQMHGFEQSIVTGPIKSANLAATFLAMCVLAPGPGTLLFDLFESTGRGQVMLNREIHGSTPSLRWQAVVQGSDSSELFMELLRVCFALDDIDLNERLERARVFAAANLARASRNPTELSTSMIYYDLMGWGSSLLADPYASLARVTAQDLRTALRELTGPLAEVTGWS